MNRQKVLKYLQILGLIKSEALTINIIKNRFFSLAKIYHPDIAKDGYKDGKEFFKIKEAANFLSANLEYANNIISGNEVPFNRKTDDFNTYEKNTGSSFNADTLIWSKINSNNINLIAYDLSKQILFVSFITSQNLTYYCMDVTNEIYLSFINSDSPESFLISKIMLNHKNGILHS